MLTITKQNNALIVKGDGNGFYPDNGTNSYPLNSISVVIDESDMATFRSAANNDVLFSGLIQDITIEGEKVTKDNIIEKFDAVANGAQGGGGDVTQAQLDEVRAIAQDADTKADAVTLRIGNVETQMNDKQDTLVSGVNIKTINSQSILGSGDLAISGGDVTQAQLDEVKAIAQDADTKADAVTSRIQNVETQMGNKQDTLVSGTNIKTINSQSILGSGDLTISGVSEEQAQEIAKIPTLETELAQKANVSDVPTVQSDNKGNSQNFIYSNEDDEKHRVIAKVGITPDTDGMNLNYTFWGAAMGYYDQIPSATTSAAGVMSAADKTKLDSIPETIPSQSEIDGIAANVSTLQTDMMGKQDTLVSGTNIKTINGNSILGEGNLVIEGGDVDLSNYYNKTEVDTKLDAKQNTLVSGTNIKTINGESVLGEGNIEVAKKTDIPSTDNLATKDELTAVETVANNADTKADAATSRVESVETSLGNKQDTLVSGTNIKTINGESVLGEGNIEISDYYTKTEADGKFATITGFNEQAADISALQTSMDGKQPTLVSGTNIKTINSQSILGEGNLEVTIPDATTATSGAMSAADKTKLDSISNEWTGTQQEYDALTTKDNNTIYYVTE